VRAVVQRVSRASVTVDDRVVGRIETGLLVLVGVSPDDGEDQVAWLADKLINLRIFTDDEDKMNLSIEDVGGEFLVVSQFTLYGDARKGRRPSFIAAARGPEAESLYMALVGSLRRAGFKCETGEFGADMDVELVNQGPVTILLDSNKLF
jgi:D-tyrosyl-tRNA(Tyr) deacylase